MKSKVAILMATYNGEKYLSEQIESIVNQTFLDWKLYIRDDGSSDGTLDIVKSFEKKYAGKIIDLSGVQGGGSSKNNFFTVLKWVSENSDSDYFMFSDQDDVWLPNKVQVSVEALKGEKGPALAHTDLMVVDKTLHTISDSFMSYSRLRPDLSDLSHLLVQNNVTGCTMIWNKSLNNLMEFDSYENIIMHDWWISLIASSFGVIKYVNEATIMYRQHGNNVVGAYRVGSIGYIADKVGGFQAIRQGIKDTYNQAVVFYEQYKSMLSTVDKKIILDYIELHNLSKFKRVFNSLKFGFVKQSLLQIVGQIIFI